MKNYIPIGFFLISILLSVLLLKEYFYVVPSTCSSYSNCKDCAKAQSNPLSMPNGCAWCLNIGKCVDLNRTGFPINNECQGNDIASYPTYCNRPASSDLPFETISGSIAVDPQTGAVVAGGGSGSGGSGSGGSGSGGSGSGGSGSGGSGGGSGGGGGSGAGGAGAGGSGGGSGSGVVPGNPISGSDLTADIGYQYAKTCPDYNIVETKIKTNLNPTIKNILKSELTRSGLTYVEGFGQLETTQKTIEAGLNDDITQSVRKAICKKTNTKSWLGKPECK